MLEYGAYVALALPVVWLALLFPLARGTLKGFPFVAASAFLALMIPFFWLGPEITELTILKVGSFKTNAELATKYFDQIKTIRDEVEADQGTISAAVTSFEKEIAQARADTKNLQQRMTDQLAKVTAKLTQAKELTDTLEKKEEYANVARYGALGLLGLAGVGLKETSPLNDIIGPYLHDEPNNFNWECTADAMHAYAAAIELDSKFPFPYLYRATCNQANNGEWQGDLQTARNIFLITTQIPGHNLQHDQFLKFIETGHFQVLKRGILGPAHAAP